MIKYCLHHFLFLLLLIFVFTLCNAQTKQDKNPLTKLPTAKNAFSSASVSSAIQDKNGNIWLGTNGEGLFKFDGKTFTHFSQKDGLDTAIIYSLLQDKLGNIWVGTKTGLCKFNGTTFTPIPTHANAAALFNLNNAASSQNGVWTMMQAKSGTIWLGTDDGVYCYNGTNFTRFLNNNIINKDSLHLKAIFSIIEDTKGCMWFGSCIGEGLIRFDGKTLQRISPKGYARTQGLVLDKKGNIWFASVGKGMCQYNGNTITTNFFKEKSTYDLMYTILKDKNEHLWFSEPSNNRSLCFYDGNELRNFTPIKNIPNPKMYPILQDNSGNIWFSAESMHLYKYDGKTFTNFSE